MLTKQWSYKELPPNDTLTKLTSLFKTPPLITQLLWQRGITNLVDAKAFFSPSLEALHDPFLMKDMVTAVQRIGYALDRQEHIGIYGDYDVDGTTSVALLSKVLQKLGASRLTHYIPDRLREGYGVSSQGIEYAQREGVELLICLDCGTRAVERLREAQKEGIDVIICDHHEVGSEDPPVVAMLNPKHPGCPYPFKGLSACGIVLKLVQAMQLQRGGVGEIEPYLDLVALSIAADIVPMVGENRILMSHGLRKLNDAPSPGIKALKAMRKQDNPLSVSDVVFGLAPYINAAGRMTHARHALSLLMAKDEKVAGASAKVLAWQNTSRKKLDEETTQEVLVMAKEQALEEDAIVIYKEGWSKGIVGIVAARCVEAYHRPTLILTQEGDQLTGSGRSVPGYNLYKALHACAHLLSRYGGHAQAVGLSLPAKSVASFAAKFKAQVGSTLLPIHRNPREDVDLRISLAELTPSACRLLGRMSPFGPAQRAPLLATWPVVVHDYQIYQGKHVKIFFREEEEGPCWDAIGFHMAAKFLSLHEKHKTFAIAYKVTLDRFRGESRIQLTLRDIKAVKRDPAYGAP